MPLTFDVMHVLDFLFVIYIRLLFGIACLAYHTAIKFALYQPLYPEFIVNCFDIKRAAATFAQFACTLMANINIYPEINYSVSRKHVASPVALYLPE